MKSNIIRHPASAATMPTFLRSRVDGYFIDRIQKEWHGDHLLQGGTTPGASAILVNNNDYLGMVGRKSIIDAQTRALAGADSGVMMSSVYFHEDNPQLSLEHRFAEFTGHGGSLLSQSGYAANVGLIQSLAGPEVPVYIDQRAHASLWEGANSANASVHAFAHNQLSRLPRMIQKNGPGVILVDSVYSNTGAACPIQEILEIAEEAGCILVVDESHSLGTHGPQGAGLVAELELTSRVHFVTASLAKTFAGRAGIVLGPKREIEYIKYEAFPSIFSSALLPVDIAGLSATLEEIKKSDHEREILHRHARRMREGLLSLGYNVAVSQSQIFAIESGSESATIILRNALEREGVFGAPFCAPAAPKNRAMIRFSVTSSLTGSQVDQILSVCAAIRHEVGMWGWRSTMRSANSLKGSRKHEVEKMAA